VLYLPAQADVGHGARPGCFVAALLERWGWTMILIRSTPAKIRKEFGCLDWSPDGLANQSGGRAIDSRPQNQSL